MNAYNIFTDVRSNLAEAEAKHWTDADVLRKINSEQRKWATIIASQPGDWLVESADVTPIASQVALPPDCAKPVYMEEKSSGMNIPINANLRDRRVTRQPSMTLYSGFIEAYPIKDYIEVNVSGYTTEVTLWYQKRIMDLICGQGANGTGAAAIVIPLEMEPSMVDDYYNDAVIECVVGTLAGTRDIVTDYVATTRTLTVAGTYDLTSDFGTVSELPQECHDIIPLGATLTLLAKPSSAVDPKYFQYFLSEYVRSRKDLIEWLASRTSGSNRTRIVEYDQ
jgi:hypothetical protein